MPIILKPGREKSLLRRHPWIFSGAVQQVDDPPAASGGTVDLLSFNREFLARAAYSPSSQIRARVWTFDPAEEVNADFFRRRIRAAIAQRSTFDLGLSTDSFRLLHAESDGIPGLIVDRYGDVLVMQSLTAGCEFWKETLADLLLEETGLKNIYERSDADVRELEGLQPINGVIRDSTTRKSIIRDSSIRNSDLPSIEYPISNLEYPISNIVITEHGLKFNVNFASGHKTGFYLDQRENRQRVRELSKGRDVLDCFCYTGGFTVNAWAGGAKSVTSVDASGEALSLAGENLSLNGMQAEGQEWIEGDVFQVLRKLRDAARSFDLIVLDPPKFAPTAAQAGKASRGYKDINRLAFKLLRPGGILVTFSCSGGVDAALFQKIVASAALDAGAEAAIVEYLAQGVDHPVSLHFPEGAYLKGLVCVKSN